jgi:hypothetical protein
LLPCMFSATPPVGVPNTLLPALFLYILTPPPLSFWLVVALTVTLYAQQPSNGR